jgi:stalled ribosome alternative rescue factor ArfA
MVRIRPVNPVARAMAQNRRRAQVVPPKRGKGSYNREKEKVDVRKHESSQASSTKATD